MTISSGATTTADAEIYEAMIHAQLSDADIYAMREQWTKLVASVTAGVIEAFKANPELARQCMGTEFNKSL